MTAAKKTIDDLTLRCAVVGRKLMPRETLAQLSERLSAGLRTHRHARDDQLRAARSTAFL